MKTAPEHDSLFRPGGEEFTRLPSQALTVWRLSSLITWLSLGILAALALGLLMPWWRGENPAWAWTALLAPPLAAWRWHQIGKLWKVTGYRLDPEQLSTRTGLLARREVSFPYGRIQLVEVSSGFLERRMGLASVSISVGFDDHVRIGPVTHDEAARLRTELTELVKKTAVEP